MAADTEARTVLVADANDDPRRVVRWMPEQRGYVAARRDRSKAVAEEFEGALAEPKRAAWVDVALVIAGFAPLLCRRAPAFIPAPVG